MLDMAIDAVGQLVVLNQVVELEVCVVGQQEQNP